MLRFQAYYCLALLPLFFSLLFHFFYFLSRFAFRLFASPPAAFFAAAAYFAFAVLGFRSLMPSLPLMLPPSLIRFFARLFLSTPRLLPPAIDDADKLSCFRRFSSSPLLGALLR